jgi:hypothetical protein
VVTAKIQIAEPGTTTHAATPTVTLGSIAAGGGKAGAQAKAAIQAGFPASTTPNTNPLGLLNPITSAEAVPGQAASDLVGAAGSVASGILGLTGITALIQNYGPRLLEILGGGVLIIFGLVVLVKAHPGGDV